MATSAPGAKRELIWSQQVRRSGLMRYAVVIEKAEENSAANAPDLPGCVATGATPERKPKRPCAKRSAFILRGFRGSPTRAGEPKAASPMPRREGGRKQAQARLL